jgi:hypothetical protein
MRKERKNSTAEEKVIILGIRLHYNTARLRSAIGHATPQDMLADVRPRSVSHKITSCSKRVVSDNSAGSSKRCCLHIPRTRLE